MSKNIYERVTNEIIGLLSEISDSEQSERHWFNRTASGGLLPLNISSKAPYRGVNTLVLWAVEQKYSFESSLWGTYKQWLELGAQVRRGEKGTNVVFWKSSPQDSAVDDSNLAPSRVFARSYTVFNSSQVDGFHEQMKEIPVLSEKARIESAEKFFRSTKASIVTGGSKAFYKRSSDTIHLPPFADFVSPLHYYSVLGHETIHWTGHEQRLDRDLGKKFGDTQYALEELIAEIGTAFLLAHLGLCAKARRDHARYIKCWLSALKDDSRTIFTAASKAQSAVDYITQVNDEISSL